MQEKNVCQKLQLNLKNLKKKKEKRMSDIIKFRSAMKMQKQI